jgi:glycerate 2-kinase
MPDLKQTARRIFHQALSAIDIPTTMHRALARDGSRIHVDGNAIDLAGCDRIIAVAIGKASVAMAQGLEQVLGPDFTAQGIVVAPAAPANLTSGLRLIVGGHPVPNEQSLEAGSAILRLLQTTDERALVFFLLSGGGSALVEQPLDPTVSLQDIQGLNRALVTCGASIDEINSVRKHISAVKGGRMAVAASKATKITLGISDVPEGQESALASGPTIPDPTTVATACEVVKRYRLLEKLPAPVRARFDDPRSIAETPKPSDPAFARSMFQILLGRRELFHPAHHAAEAAGFVTMCDNSTDDWPLDRAAAYLLQQVMDWKAANPARPVALIAGGEVSSPVTGNGVGGRNSAFALHLVSQIAGRKISVLSAGTDGVDGSSPAAGAVADGETLRRAQSAGLDPDEYFRRSDSYSFFKQLGDTVETGPTGNNLRDLRILLAE